MKLCKDCTHYKPAISSDGGSLLPVFFFYTPATCDAQKTPITINPINGEPRGGFPSACRDMREDENKCGMSGHWFIPATLDGRLAMLSEG